MQKRLLLFFGSILLVMLLAVLPLVSSCKGAEEGEAEEGEAEGEKEEGEKLPVVTLMRCLDAPPSPAELKWFIPMMEELQKITPNYDVVYEPHYGSELFPGPQGNEAMAAGAIAIGGSTMSYYAAGYIPAVGIFQVPFLFTSEDQITEFWFSPEFQSEVIEEYERRGILHLLPTREEGSSHYEMILLFKEEVTCLEDMEGMRIRCMESPPMIKSVELLGAQPISVTTSELTVAMQTGMMDGLIAGMTVNYIRMLGYMDYMSYGIEWPQVTFAPSGHLACSKQWYESLPDEVRDAWWQLLPAYEKGTHDDRMDEITEAIELIRVGTVNKKLVRLTEAEFDRWKEALSPIIDDLRKTIGDSLVDAYLRTRD